MSRNVINMIQSRPKWAGHAVRMGEKRTAYRDW